MRAMSHRSAYARTLPALALLAAHVRGGAAGRSVSSFDFDWKFKLGEDQRYNGTSDGASDCPAAEQWGPLARSLDTTLNRCV